MAIETHERPDHPAVYSTFFGHADEHLQCRAIVVGLRPVGAFRNQGIENITGDDNFHHGVLEVDALISERPYRPQSYDKRTALEVLVGMAEKGALDSRVVRALVSFNRQAHPHFTRCELSRERRGAPPANNLYRLRSDDDGSRN